jgi:hypothetical protein
MAVKMMQAKLVGWMAMVALTACGGLPPLGAGLTSQVELEEGARVMFDANGASLRSPLLPAVAWPASRLAPPALDVLYRPQPSEPAPARSEECVATGQPSASVFTSTKPGGEETSSGRPGYSIYSTPGVFVGAVVHDLCGAHQGTFEFFAPDGSLFKRFEISFNAQGEGEGARRVAGGYLVGVGFPIAGTEVALRPILGTWSVNFIVDNEDHALGIGLFDTSL